MFSAFGNTQNASGSAFGNTGQQSQQLSGPGAPGGSLFSGLGPINTQPATGGSLFGNTNQQATSGNPLFGNTNQSAPTTGGNPLFGNTNSQAPTTSGNPLFGGGATNTQSTGTGGGLFGTASNQPGGGLFGNTSTQPAGGSAFGNTANQPASGGLFGAQPAAGTAAPAGNSLFGNSLGSTNTNSTGGSLFGNTAGTGGSTGGGLFGGTTNTAAGNNPSGGNLFGNTGAGTNTNLTGGLFSNTAGGNNTNTTGSSLFGNTLGAGNTSAPSGGLFGNAGNSGGGLFGNSAGGSGTNTIGSDLFGGNTGGNTSTSTGGGLFGGSTTNAPSSGLFGGASNNSTGNTTGGLFGNSTAAPSTLGSLLNQSQAGTSSAGPSWFGGSTLGPPSQQQRSGLFGNTLGLLGSTQNFLSSRATTTPGQQQADAQSQFAALAQRIESIAQAWNPNSPQCRFQHYFYNLVDPNQVHMYGRPQNATNDELWQKAVRENPDPNCLVPVVANGFDDLQQRVEAQTQQATAHQEKLKELQTRISALAQRHHLSNASRLQRASALQTQLTHRVLRLVQHLHLLIPAIRSSAIRPEEEAFRAALEDIDQEIRRPGGIGRMRGKLNELWALVGAVTAAKDRDRKGGTVEWAVVDDEGLAQIAQILADEQAGLAHLTRILQHDLKDLAIIQGTSVKEQEPDLLMNSTSALHGRTVY